MDTYQLLAISAAVIGSAMIKNSVGIGAGIFLLLLLSPVLSPKMALGLGAPAMLVSDLIGVKNYWQQWDKMELIYLLPPAFLGVIIGSRLISIIPSHIFTYLVAFTAIIFSSASLIKEGLPTENNRKQKPTPPDRRSLTVLCGLLGGIASTLIHAGGTVMSIYLIRNRSSNRRFVGSLVLFFAAINCLKVITYSSIGILNREALLLVGLLSPLIILGGIFGSVLNKKISAGWFRKIVLILIFLIGCRLLVNI